MESVFVAVTTKVSKRESKRKAEVVWRRLPATARSIGGLKAGGKFVEHIEEMIPCSTACADVGPNFCDKDVFKGQLLPRFRSEPKCLGGLERQGKKNKELCSEGFLFLNGMLLVASAQVSNESQVRVGIKSTIGKRIQMEDTNCIAMNVARVPLSLGDMGAIIPDYIKDQNPKHLSAAMSELTWKAEQKRLQALYGDNIRCVYDDIHMFTVCDGHGGRSVSQYCADRIQGSLEEALEKHLQESFSCLMHQYALQREAEVDSQENMAANSFGSKNGRDLVKKSKHSWKCQKMTGPDDTLREEVATTHYVEETSPFCFAKYAVSASPSCKHDPCKVGLTAESLADAMKQSFEQVNQEVRQAQLGEIEGSTMVMVLVGTWIICVASCGDSRAVLSRGGEAIRLTRDHKPDLEDEKTRVCEDGGFIMEAHGCSRVNGILAMSRAIGDHSFMGITATPECTVFHRTHDDDFLIIASDGLWDVMDDEEACRLTKKCLSRADARNASAVGATVAATVLMRAAASRGSTDNTTVMVIDLREGCTSDLHLSKRTKIVASK